MIEDFSNRIAADLFHHGSSKKLPRELWNRAIQLLDVMDAVESFEDLERKGFPPSLRLHKRKGDRKGEFAIDINKVSGWRIIFKFVSGHFSQVGIENYH